MQRSSSRANPVIVVREPWRAHPLACIHRAEARSIARELGAQLISGDVPPGSLLRLSDPVMRKVVRTLRVPYFGPGSAALERCYDKYEACRWIAGAPRTFLASEAHALLPPFVLKPRRGSDSIGVRLVGDVPLGKRDRDHLVQEYIVGDEVTVALFRERVGMPLHILLPPGAPYSFLRKYFWRPARKVLRDEAIRDAALAAGRALGVDWAARVDFIVRDGRPFFLECDAAPLVGPDSAFAASFVAAGVERATQLAWLTS
jgi:D-alanine-D-alanine ligase-like ATP-grasp enzyme